MIFIDFNWSVKSESQSLWRYECSHSPPHWVGQCSYELLRYGVVFLDLFPPNSNPPINKINFIVLDTIVPQNEPRPTSVWCVKVLIGVVYKDAHTWNLPFFRRSSLFLHRHSYCLQEVLTGENELLDNSFAICSSSVVVVFLGLP